MHEKGRLGFLLWCLYLRRIRDNITLGIFKWTEDPFLQSSKGEQEDCSTQKTWLTPHPGPSSMQWFYHISLNPSPSTATGSPTGHITHCRIQLSGTEVCHWFYFSELSGKIQFVGCRTSLKMRI